MKSTRTVLWRIFIIRTSCVEMLVVRRILVVRRMIGIGSWCRNKTSGDKPTGPSTSMQFAVTFRHQQYCLSWESCSGSGSRCFQRVSWTCSRLPAPFYDVRDYRDVIGTCTTFRRTGQVRCYANSLTERELRNEGYVRPDFAKIESTTRIVDIAACLCSQRDKEGSSG